MQHPSSQIVGVSGVSLWRGRKMILRDITWRIDPGQHWAVLGRNRAGKTTMLNVVSGYLWASEGQVSVLGHRFGSVDLRDLRRRIGWVSSAFQTRIPPACSALDAVLSEAYDLPLEVDRRHGRFRVRVRGEQ